MEGRREEGRQGGKKEREGRSVKEGGRERDVDKHGEMER